MLQAIIHPVWLIDEYARRGRICVWLIPPSPPTSAPSAPTYIGIKEFLYMGRWMIIQIGIIFCHVVRIRHKVQLSLDITFGSQ